MKELLNINKDLCLTFGPSGYEDLVSAKIKDLITPYALENSELYFDKVGNLYYHIPKENAPSLMINAHMDEVGFMATSINSDGSISFGTVGGFDTIILPSKKVICENGLKGVILSKPVHLLSRSQRKKPIDVDDLVIDIGAESKEEAEKLISLGDYFAFDLPYVEFGEGQICSKALDDRLGCAIMVKLIMDIKEQKIDIPYDLYFAFTCREEVGYSSCFGAAERIKPNYAIVIESKAVSDLYGVEEEKHVAQLGKGGVISFADCGAILDRDLVKHIISLCEKGNVKYQMNRSVSGGNDSSNIQRSAGGAKVALISAPSRYIHSSSNVIHKTDMESIYKALYGVLTDKNPLK
ncbi:MAG: M20/M25/M40 family metallo-hydrolase [Clostridia bacterium]|nr:M20/M25/M40 family metallo-hydrolase [Clostridia bacterium]